MRRSLLATTVAVLVLAPLAAGCADDVDHVVLTVSHPPVSSVALTDADPSGPSAGDVRTIHVEGTDNLGRAVRVDAILTTTAEDVPAAGVETRVSTIVFTWVDSGSQLVVQGSAAYTVDKNVLDENTVVERPLTGGSGEFEGVTGSATSTHLADDSWTHELHFDL
ncbi:MAG: hypothetical protein ACO3C1_00755 [Ilumatobacteraceae bacterium]